MAPVAEASRSRWRGPRAAFLIVLTGCAILIALGTWQVQRLAWKTDLIATMDARLALPPANLSDLLAAGTPEDFRPVRVNGTFLHDHEMYLAARSYQSQLGYHVVTPLLLDGGGPGSQAVLVDRGWVPVDRQKPESRAAGQLPGKVTVEGILRLPAKPGTFTPDNRPDQNMWYWPDLPAMGAHAGLAQVAPVLIEAGPEANPGGLPIGGQTRVNLPNDHLQYAITWYALAVTLVVIYLVSRRRRTAGPPIQN
jgi:surfeit locus 1 family protein